MTMPTPTGDAPEAGPVPSLDVTRAALYQLFGGLLLECASEQALRDLHAKELLPTLARDVAEPALSDALQRMHAALGSDESIQRLRSDHAQLFLGAGKSKTHPWESMYRSEERMVWSGPAYGVLSHYARAGLGYDDMASLPPDHVGRELLFVATLSVEALEADDARRAELLAAKRAFLDEHLTQWMPQFLSDLREHASTDFFKAIADGLTVHLGSEESETRPSA